MEQEPQYPGSHLFTLRLWQEQLGGGETEWRGRAQDIVTGAEAYFRDWPGLIAALTRLLDVSSATAEAPPAQPFGAPLDKAGA